MCGPSPAVYKGISMDGTEHPKYLGKIKKIISKLKTQTSFMQFDWHLLEMSGQAAVKIFQGAYGN